MIAGIQKLLRNEDGFTLVELMGAMTILAVAFFTLAATATAGLRLVAQGRQRQAAAEVANARLEHLRNIPYDGVALNASLTRSTDVNDPDYFVDATGTEYDYDGDGTFEDLVIETSTGEVPHIEDPVAVGNTLLRIYQYVTWVDAPTITGTQDYKRLTVVAAYRTPVNTGRARNVTVSALLTTGGVVVEGDESTATVGSTSTPTPTPTVTPSGTCSGDTAAPTGTFSLLSGAGATVGYSASGTVTVSMAPSDGCAPIRVAFSNDNVTYGTEILYDSTNPSTTWTLSSGDGTKSVWARFKDGNDNSTILSPKSITVDTVKPVLTGSLSRTLGCSGSNRTVNLTWGAGTDTNLQGYRVYQSLNGADYTALLTAATQTGTDTHAKNLDSVRYYVVAYDKAGNESAASNEISLSKNTCA